MCEALMELMQEEMDALIEQCREQYIAESKKELVQKKLAKGKSIEEIADALEESVEAIEEIIRNM